MIEHPAFTVDEWSIIEKTFRLDLLAQTESLFALSNGHIGLRGNLDEGEPYGLPGTYLNSVYELHPLPYAEAQYGSPESAQTMINVTNGKLIRLLVDDEPFDIRYGELKIHKRELDMRNGVLQRQVRWTSPVGRTVKISSTRMVSFTLRNTAAICYEVEVEDAPAHIVIQSELVANEEHSGSSDDPRSSTVATPPLISEEHQAHKMMGLLVHRTQQSNLRIAAAMDHVVEGLDTANVTSESTLDVARFSVTTEIKPGERIRIIKFLSYGWSAERSRSALHDQVMAGISSARQLGWDGLLAQQRAYLDKFWESAVVEVEGDPEIQQAVRFALFHILQAGSRSERRAIPAKGLTGSGYEGHAFWDTEIFVLPVLSFILPQATADALHWRYSTLDLAKKRARQLDLQGAAFPWRTIVGEECSGYWPASTAAFHINADIAHAVLRYVEATGDTDFEEKIGLELLVETARLWQSLGHYDSAGRFRIDGVTGPDEYSAISNNNAYTNLMAQQNLQAAADAAQRHHARARTLGVKSNEIKDWENAAKKMLLPYDERLKVIPQSESFTELQVWDFDATTPEQYPLFLHFPYFDLYRKQVIKQADLLLAMQLRNNIFTLEEKERNFAYYEPLTVRDSSLSACTQAIIAAEVGHISLAYDYLGEAALMDLDNLEHNAQDGVHIASLGGSWLALVMGLGGLRYNTKGLYFKPCLPEQITRLNFRMLYRDRRLLVEVRPTEATYHLLAGKDLPLSHYDKEFILSTHKSVTHKIVPHTDGPRPSQPRGRAPMERGKRRRS
ncbi:glycoside hydrolase family 65 protein [Dictyobacter arantiisoli]|uniref:Glycosyl hydrolase n=1 Tax=Dictyobacter arantiisoli TaxID=2014874 RepID=A0A5A5TF77_9CHLR|nr:glycosyl hydrolase family 65 protein [Dictyobacter arantiisoli]GCF09997.1 glycosyl hydrolase [Dictyobacter arantiisoli]